MSDVNCFSQDGFVDIFFTKIVIYKLAFLQFFFFFETTKKESEIQKTFQ